MTLRMPAPGDDVVGEVTMVQIARHADTLNDYAGLRLRLSRADGGKPGINPWVPGEGAQRS
ncbi:MAG: hypothetical protein IPF57_03970 [Gammaproteobacteria bacterium]|nr:hypothetical protein [Gammaproteobacteria bacterium]